MELSSVKKVYLVGIGGIGMSGLARYFAHRGAEVAGYDRTPTTLTRSLENEGIRITYTDAVDEILPQFRDQQEGLLVIYTPAIPKDSAILNFFQNGFSPRKRSEVLGIISKGMFTLAVAGTHGKTTTSTILAHILRDAGKDPSAFLGGIASNYDTNVLFGHSNLMVVEADEYDRSFLTLHPDIAIITSMDADHLDIYGDPEHLTESFRLFSGLLKDKGKLLHRAGLDLTGGIEYSASKTAEVRAENIRVEDGRFVFDFVGTENIRSLRLALPGDHNVENAVAAIQAALWVGVNPGQVRQAIENFTGVKRRFERVVETEKRVYIDDYAHHPEELRACIAAVRKLYPQKKLTAIFQPHLYSRTRDFAEGFAEVLSQPDELILLDIYPARELPIPGVSSDIIFDRVTLQNKKKCGKEAVAEYIANTKPELLLTVGAGDIDTLVEPLKTIMRDA